MKIDIQRIKKQLGFPSDRPLTLQEKRRYMKFAVYPLFFLIFAGIVLLIYSPTEKEKAEAEKERGFNTEIPSPEESRMEGNKVSAYEREALSKKERGRKDTFLENVRTVQPEQGPERHHTVSGQRSEPWTAVRTGNRANA